MFALAYISRCLLSIYGYCNGGDGKLFSFEMILAIIFLIEGLSMGVLMAFHYVNFKNGSLLKEDE